MSKTTLELPADLLRRVKARAAEQGRSMKSLITEVLENTLRQAEPPTAAWRAVFGRAKPGSTRYVDRSVTELRRVDQGLGMILDTNAVSGLLEGHPTLEVLLAREIRHELPVIVGGCAAVDLASAVLAAVALGRRLTRHGDDLGNLDPADLASNGWHGRDGDGAKLFAISLYIERCLC